MPLTLPTGVYHLESCPSFRCVNPRSHVNRRRFCKSAEGLCPAVLSSYVPLSIPLPSPDPGSAEEVTVGSCFRNRTHWGSWVRASPSTSASGGTRWRSHFLHMAAGVTAPVHKLQPPHVPLGCFLLSSAFTVSLPVFVVSKVYTQSGCTVIPPRSTKTSSSDFSGYIIEIVKLKV